MKTKDIVVGTDHAHDRWPRSRYGRRADARVRVLETGVERQVGAYYNKTVRRDGVRILFVANDGRKLPGMNETVVPAEQIVRTWEQELAERADSEERERQSQEREFKVTAHRMRVKGYLALLGLRQDRWPQDGDYSIASRSDNFEFTPDELLKLVTTVAGLAEIVGGVPTLNLVRASTRKARGEERYQIMVNGIPVDEDWYSQDEAKAFATAINEGVKPDADEDEEA